MICQFSVKNFKSIKDEVTLNMQALNLHEYNNSLIKYEDNENYLPIAAIYGPNGGGKSNVLLALKFIVNKIVEPVGYLLNNDLKNNDKIEIERKKVILNAVPFKFNDNTIDEPSSFDLFFRINNYEYHYNTIIKNDFYIEEYLSRKKIKAKNYNDIFVRKDNDVKLYGTLSGTNCRNISKELSVISYLRITYNNNKLVSTIYDFFKYSIISFDVAMMPIRWFPQFLEEIEELKLHDKIVPMLKEIDIDIQDYEIRKEGDKYCIYTKRIINGAIKELNLIEESNGTQKMMKLLTLIIICLRIGTTVIADELDCNLHPKLLGYIIELFTNPKINKKGSQLIFSSHDLITMSSEYLRRDEIWFISKNSEDSSYLYSLAEFKKENGKATRNDEKYNKQYLEGRYGSDPYLQRIIKW